MPVDASLAASRAREVKLLVLDVDGVMTDGGLYIDAQGGIAKRFNVHDGLGIKAAQAVGLDVAVISGLDSPAASPSRATLKFPKRVWPMMPVWPPSPPWTAIWAGRCTCPILRPSK